MANEETEQPKEVCRMSWFLVQVENSPKTGKYFIIHSVDISDADSGNMYVDSFVKFRQNQNILEGKILVASEERTIVEQEMQNLMRAAEKQQPNERFFLLQYSGGFSNVNYTVLPEKEIVWPTVLTTDIREVIVNDAQDHQRIATILMSDYEQKFIERKFQQLKEHTFKKCLENTTAVGDGQWIWVQFSSAPYTVVYAIINQRDNVWYEQNLYKDVVAYFQQGQNIYQAIVLQRDEDIKVLLKKMSIMKESCQQNFMETENKENVNAAGSGTAGGTASPSTAASAGNRITFYGSHLNTNGPG